MKIDAQIVSQPEHRNAPTLRSLQTELGLRIFKLKPHAGGDAFKRIRGDVGLDGSSGRSVGYAATTGTKASGALFAIPVNILSADRSRRILTQGN